MSHCKILGHGAHTEYYLGKVFNLWCGSHIHRSNEYRKKKWLVQEQKPIWKGNTDTCLSLHPHDECFNGRNNIQLVSCRTVETFEVTQFSCFSLQMRKLRPRRLNDLLWPLEPLRDQAAPGTQVFWFPGFFLPSPCWYSPHSLVRLLNFCFLFYIFILCRLAWADG